jgi:hypothetical protein
MKQEKLSPTYTTKIKEFIAIRIIKEVLAATTNWKTMAKETGISRSEQELMTKAFKLASGSS